MHYVATSESKWTRKGSCSSCTLPSGLLPAVNESAFLLHLLWDMLDSGWVLLSTHIVNIKLICTFLIFRLACDTDMKVLIFFPPCSLIWPLAHPPTGPCHPLLRWLYCRFFFKDLKSKRSIVHLTCTYSIWDKMIKLQQPKASDRSGTRIRSPNAEMVTTHDHMLSCLPMWISQIFWATWVVFL